MTIWRFFGCWHNNDVEEQPRPDLSIRAKTNWTSLHNVIVVTIGLLMNVGCDRLDMYEQPRYDPLESSRFFGDGLSARPHVEGTIARGSLRDDEAFFTGREGSEYVAQIPAAAYRAIREANPKRFAGKKAVDDADPIEQRIVLIERGQDRFNIYCSVCHGRTGDGDGMVVRRGFRRPPSYHSDRLRQSASGYFFDVMTNGFGAMPSFSNRIEAQDRWAIAAYLRALQLSHNGRLEDVEEQQRTQLVDQINSTPPKGDVP